MSEELNQLYIKKGELITNLEILQGQLKAVNQQIFELLQQQPKKEGKKKDPKKSKDD